MDISEICHNVLYGKMAPEVAESFFGHEKSKKMDFYCVTHDVNIEIRPKVVVDMLRCFLQGKKTIEQLKEWALFILMTGAFITPNRELDETFRYDPMWTILGKLSTPEIDGRITASIAQEYIEQLQAIKEEF